MSEPVRRSKDPGNFDVTDADSLSQFRSEKEEGE